MVYTASAVAVNVVQLRLILHYLPAQTAGIWTLFVTCGTYIALLDLGMTPTVGREISLLSGGESKGPHSIATLLQTVFACSRYLAGGVCALSLGLGMAVLVSRPTFHHDHTALLAWSVFSIGAATNLLGSPAYAGLFGLGHVADEKIIRSVALVGGLLLTTVFLALGWGLLGAAAAWTLQGLFARSLALWRLRRLVGSAALQKVPVDWKLARSLSIPSLKLAGIQIASVAILQSANPIIASRIGTVAIPSYESVSRISLTLMTFALLVVSASTPFISMAYAAGDLEGIRRLLSRNVRTGMAMIIVPCAFIAVYGDQVVNVWLGRGVFPGFPVLWVLLAVVLLEVHHVIYATAVMATGKVVFVPAAMLSGAMNLALAFFLAPRMGLLGIALAASISQLTTNNWYAPFRAFRLFHLPVGESLRTLALPCLLLLLAQLGIMVFLRHSAWFPVDSVLGLAGPLTVSVLCGAALFAVLCMTSDERRSVYTLLRGRVFAA